MTTTSTSKKQRLNINPEKLRLAVGFDNAWEQQPTIREKFGLCSWCTVTYEEGSGNEKAERHVRVSYDELTKLKLLGKGGFGEVWKMRHEPSDRIFAVKIIRESQMEPFNQKSVELEASRRIGHSSSYLVSFYGALHIDSHIWLLTEPMDLSLEKFDSVKANIRLRVPEYFYSHVARSTLNGLAHMKSLKLIHRDIKPSNILMNSRGSVKLCDFGISGFTTKDSIAYSFKGCNGYMAPEKLTNTDKGYSIKSDIWSLAISLIEVASGIHPYASAGGHFSMSAKILTEESPKLDRGKFSESFCDFIQTCLIKDVAARPGCRELLDSHPFVDRNLIQKYKTQITTIVNVVIERCEAQ